MMAILRIVWVTGADFLLLGSATRGLVLGGGKGRFAAHCGTIHCNSPLAAMWDGAAGNGALCVDGLSQNQRSPYTL
jgi:hypothetical protein